MNSQIVRRSAPPPRGLWSEVRRDLLTGVVLSVVWAALWALVTARWGGPR